MVEVSAVYTKEVGFTVSKHDVMETSVWPAVEGYPTDIAV
jgi:hypothetical protein